MIFVMLEYDYLILVVLKSVIEWLLYIMWLLINKLVMIVGVLNGLLGILCV